MWSCRVHSKAKWRGWIKVFHTTSYSQRGLENIAWWTSKCAAASPETLQVRCGPCLKLCKYEEGPSDFASVLRSRVRLCKCNAVHASDFASMVRPCARLCKCAAVRHNFMIDRSALAKSEAWTASHLQSLRSEANKCGEAKPQRTCKVRSVLAKLYAVLGGNGNW